MINGRRVITVINTQTHNTNFTHEDEWGRPNVKTNIYSLYGQVADRGITAHESTRAEESEATAMIIVQR